MRAVFLICNNCRIQIPLNPNPKGWISLQTPGATVHLGVSRENEPIISHHSFPSQEVDFCGLDCLIGFFRHISDHPDSQDDGIPTCLPHKVDY